jgi:hypothetical protein
LHRRRSSVTEYVVACRPPEREEADARQQRLRATKSLSHQENIKYIQEAKFRLGGRLPSHTEDPRRTPDPDEIQPPDVRPAQLEQTPAREKDIAPYLDMECGRSSRRVTLVA